MNFWVFITETLCVYCAVRTESYIIITWVCVRCNDVAYFVIRPELHRTEWHN
jgi:hypothetical protein